MNTPGEHAAGLAQSITHAKNGGYRDGFTGQTANPPAWGTIPEWSFAYAEGYHLGRKAARKIKPKQQQALF